MVNVLAPDSSIEVSASMYEVAQTIFTVFLLVAMIFFTYMSVHMAEEKRQKRTIPLPWERNYKFKCFDKSMVKYRDGDNT